ncbi:MULTISPECIES: hypothetical protein [unclassified Streptomyces]|uniref:hypothetical protein n=1 Tax=unclassified Streptomyces TaxID=2593676 RepID=UPI003BB55E9D
MTDRIPLDELNSDQYDALCEQADDAARHKDDYLRACATIAAMHEAATGRTGEAPTRGVVEDVADVRARMLAAEEALDNEQRAHAGPATTAPALRARLREAIGPILTEYPEHNRTDEHEAILGEIITAVLGVVLPGARAMAALGRMSEADVQRVIAVIEQGQPYDLNDERWEAGWNAAMNRVRAALMPTQD